MNTMLERLGAPFARNARYFAPGDSFRIITPNTNNRISQNDLDICSTLSNLI